MIALISEAWAVGYVVAEWSIRLAMVAVVPMRRSPEAARSWLILVFLLPIPALLIYLLIGRPTYPRWRRERFLRLPAVLAAASREISHSRYCRRPELPGSLSGPALLVERLGQFPTVAGNDFELLSGYDEVIDRMIADIGAAQQTVHLLYYIFADDETGLRVIDALQRAAKRQVKCRVLIDAIGSRRWARRVARLLIPAGVEVRLALRVGLFHRRSARADLRNHRKIAVIDSRVGYLGSQNIINAEFGGGIANQELVARVVGPVTTEIQTVFIADWFMETNEKLANPVLFPHNPPGGGAVAQVLPSGPDYPDAGIGHLIVSLVHGARERVIITTPYFVPDEPLLQALKTAALRGVEVRLVVSNVTDQMLVNLAQRSFYSELLHAGIQVHLYAQAFLHAKHITFDDEIAILGSSNVDIRSFVLNAEVSLIAFDKGVVEQLRRQQSRYFASSNVLSLREWEKRPVASKLAENLARLASPLL
ncbi:cardiolipin synthase [Neoaquamicrobium sediminum]|uniref:Cardiolipin synthase n=1 Tax=Neoaquamicrobium sediminum TaxID=1849104 RepID=A0ABV3X1E6_9HYPH